MLNALPATNVYGTSNPLQEQTSQSKASEEIRTNNNERVDVRSVENLDEDSGASESNSQGGESRRAPPLHLPPQTRPRNAYFDEEGAFSQQISKSQGNETTNRRAVDAFLKNAAPQPEAAARAAQGNAEALRPSVDAVA